MEGKCVLKGLYKSLNGLSTATSSLAAGRVTVALMVFAL